MNVSPNSLSLDRLEDVSLYDEDPRHRNERCDNSSVGDYLFEYASRLRSALLTVDACALDRAHALIEGAAYAGKRIYAVGNGGSAAIADHLCCDWTKGTHVPGHPVVSSFSMTSNVALYSAIANDFGFEKVFSTQVALLGREGDVLVAISSSGNSANILGAVKAARGVGMSTIGLSGFDGGELKDAVDASIHVRANNYGIVEDAHQSVIHVLAQYIACNREG
jgi:D-sedoheptulose 7-phosphate isomerase